MANGTKRNSFSVSAYGRELSYYWKKYSKSGEHGQEIKSCSTLTIYSLVYSSTLYIKSVSEREVGMYSCVVSNFAGSVESQKASLKLKAKIEQQPESQQVGEREPVTLTVKATGTNLKYQWTKDYAPLHDSDNISGVTEEILTIKKASVYLRGNYRCTVSNDFSKDFSRSAFIDVGKQLSWLYIT